MSAPLTDRDRELLVALADGALTGRSHARAAARLARVPDGARALERQRRVARALQAGPPGVVLDGDDAPAAGVGRLAGRGATARPGRLTRRGRLAAPGIAVAVVAALAAAVIVVSVRGGSPAVAAVARLGMLAPQAPAPASAGTTLRADLDGLRFPDWAREFGWRAVGTRSDRVGGRATTTVFYAHTMHTIGYTIVDGPALDIPDGARRVRRDGVEIALYRDAGGRDVAVFERDGRTCVLAGHVMHRDTLVKLAAWRPA